MSATDWAGRRLHFIGIGGAGMSGLALVARALGATVSGSDRAESSYVARLRAAGIEPAIGHDAANVPDGAEVVVSTAIGAANPELARARDEGRRELHRGDLLAEIALLKRCFAIAGTHGKTTTASMAAHVLLALGREPAYLIGGELRSSGTNAAWGAGDWIVVEADESDRSFLKLTPDFASIPNIEWDHHATYGSEQEVVSAFAEFTARSGRTAAWVEAPPVGASETFGIDAGDLVAHDVRLEGNGARFVVDGVEIALAVPGRHNVVNALAALAGLQSA